MKFPKVHQQVISLSIIIGFAVTGFLIARHFSVPPSFGLYGHYRANALGELKAREPKYAGTEACVECHDDIYQLKATGYHKNLACEVCHGPAGKHAEDPTGVKPQIPHERKNCTICHNYNPARPQGFPQIIAEQHNPGKFCTQCHKAHNPTLPHTPDDCSACHRKIWNQKMVSHHASLVCTTCHEVPPEHFTNPRAFEVKKPSTKEACGQCHDKKAQAAPEIPRVDIATHGGRYMCWDCHYPHHPEVNQ